MRGPRVLNASERRQQRATFLLANRLGKFNRSIIVDGFVVGVVNAAARAQCAQFAQKFKRNERSVKTEVPAPATPLLATRSSPRTLAAPSGNGS